MGKHRDLREVRVRQQGHHARKPQGDERAERWRDPGRTVEQACNDTWTSAGDNFEPSAAELCFPLFFVMSSLKTTRLDEFHHTFLIVCVRLVVSFTSMLNLAQPQLNC